MDDLQAVTRALVDNGPTPFNLAHEDDADVCRIYAKWLRATFRRDETGKPITVTTIEEDPNG